MAEWRDSVFRPGSGSARVLTRMRAECLFADGLETPAQFTLYEANGRMWPRQ
jgi:hypothetical protein